MTIDEAIKKLNRDLSQGLFGEDSDLERAVKLGIEALKEIKRLRSYKAFHVVKLLEEESV